MSKVEELRDQGWGDALLGCAAGLEADGYELSLVKADGRIVGEVKAGADACEDCLVPKAVFVSILARAGGFDPELVDLSYPADAG